MTHVLFNRTTGHVDDGHLRVELAISRGEPTVPVVYVELSEEEDRLVLASLDPWPPWPTAEKEALAALLAGIETEDAGLARMLAELADHHSIRRSVLGDPDETPPVHTFRPVERRDAIREVPTHEVGVLACHGDFLPANQHRTCG